MYGLKKTNEQQSEHIKQLHEREQNLLSQAVSLLASSVEFPSSDWWRVVSTFSQTSKSQDLTKKKYEIERIRQQIETGTNNIKELKNKLSEQEFQANEVKMWLRTALPLIYSVTDRVHIHQLQKTFSVKDKHLEKATRDKEQIEQELERMKRKIESMSQSDNPAEEELRQECEELRVRIKSDGTQSM